MDHFKEDLLNCLKDLKGSGKFISIGTDRFFFPHLEVGGLGEIAYPVNETQAKALIQIAHKAPFGKGSETIIDNRVRSAWEIDAAMLTFNSGDWNRFLDKILDNIKHDLGLENYVVSAHLYKLLIYEKGDFFLPHKDSEKEKGMFGTLVIGLPSKYTGGELEVSFDGVKEIADFAHTSGDYKINYAAFYADCDHEVKKLTSGYRVCLVYNLVQQKSGERIQVKTIGKYAEKLAEIFVKQQQYENTKPHIILLGHQYTPKNFSVDNLKLNDRPRAQALVQAAQKAGCYAKLCLVTSYLSGLPEESGGYYDDYYDEDATMVEVYDEMLYIDHWLENSIPALSKVGFEESDLITSFNVNDGEPIVKEVSGYMGNYGPDLMHWYHYGAVMIWSSEVNAQLFPKQNTESKLEWIDYFNKNLQQISDHEISAVNAELSIGLSERFNQKGNYNSIADWIINNEDETFFLRLNPSLSQFYFTKIDATHWLKLLDFFTKEITDKIILQVTQDATLPVVEQLLAVLRELLVAGKLESLVIEQIKEIEHYFTALATNLNKKQSFASRAALRDLFSIEQKKPQDNEWIIRMSETLTTHLSRSYVHGILVPQLLAQKQDTQLTRKLLQICKQYLQEQVNNQPQPPADWSRQAPEIFKKTKHWRLLKPFLESPDEKIFDYRKKQSERDELQTAIKNVTIDLKTETIRKGSPHTLRITKTQGAYQRAMGRWKEDSKLLEAISLRI